jgi:O-antigen/teichoic acid export membrane protein
VKDWLKIGWPIVMANTCVSLIQFADRFAVSWAATIQNFAQYSLAASAMGVPMMAIQACSNVFFSHLAGVTPGGRKRIYGISSRLLLIAWAMLLPYYFALDIFVRHFVPKYLASLQYARVLLLGIPFLAAVQILQTNYAYLTGVQRQFFARTVAVLTVSLGITSFVAFHFGSLRIVAAAQVMVLAGWWLSNEWTLRGLTGEGFLSWARFLLVYSLTGISYWMVTASARNRPLIAVFLCYIAAAVALCIFSRGDVRVLRRAARGN